MIAPPRAFVYVRAPVAHEQWGLERQLAVCRDYCAQHGLDASGREYIDEGPSAAKPMRKLPNGQALLAELRRGDRLVVSCFTRLGNSLQSALAEHRRLLKRGVDLCIAEATVTPDFRLLLAVAEEFVTLDGLAKAESISWGQTKAAALEGYHRPQPPAQIGTQHVSRTDQTTGQRMQLVAEHEGEQLLAGYCAWWFWIDGLSHEAIQMRLNEKAWLRLRKAAKHEQGRGRPSYCFRTVKRACDDGRQWLNMVATHSGSAVPPVDQWNRDPETRTRRKPCASTSPCG